MIARADQAGLRLAGTAAAAVGVAGVQAPWASAELVERSRRVFSRLYGRPVSIEETRGMLERAAQAMAPTESRATSAEC